MTFWFFEILVLGSFIVIFEVFNLQKYINIKIRVFLESFLLKASLYNVLILLVKVGIGCPQTPTINRILPKVSKNIWYMKSLTPTPGRLGWGGWRVVEWGAIPTKVQYLLKDYKNIRYMGYLPPLLVNSIYELEWKQNQLRLVESCPNIFGYGPFLMFSTGSFLVFLMMKRHFLELKF